MSLYDLYEGNDEPDDEWVEIDGVWECPECGTASDQCVYNNDKGVVGGMCEEHSDETIFIGKGLA